MRQQAEGADMLRGDRWGAARSLGTLGLKTKVARTPTAPSVLNSQLLESAQGSAAVPLSDSVTREFLAQLVGDTGGRKDKGGQLENQLARCPRAGDKHGAGTVPGAAGAS